MEIFSVTTSAGHEFKGRLFKAGEPKANLLILEGMEEHSARYEPFAQYLNGLGIEVLVLDAAGQGLNVEKVEDLQKWYVGAFDDNVEAANLCIQELRKTDRPTSIMGHSMGSFMVQRYLELYPNTVDSVILCGSNGGQAGLMKVANFLAKITVNKKNWDKPSKLLQDLGIGGYSKAIKNRKTDLDWLSYNEENVQRYIDDPYCGVRNTNGFWKEFLKVMSILWSKKEVSKVYLGERILIIAGQDDPVGQCGKGLDKLEAMYRKHGVKDITKIIYSNMRHEILNEVEHDIVYNDVSNFLLKTIVSE